MTRIDFEAQVARLKSTWPNSWPDEKVKLVWVTVYQEPSQWFEKVISNMIATYSRSPLPQDFKDLTNLLDKKRFSANYDHIHPARSSVFSQQEVSEMFQFMKDAASGKRNKKEVKEYADMVAQALRSKGITPDPY